MLRHSQDRVVLIDQLWLLPERVVGVSPDQDGGIVLREFVRKPTHFVPVHYAVEREPIALVWKGRDSLLQALLNFRFYTSKVVDQRLISRQEIDRRDAGDPVPKSSRRRLRSAQSHGVQTQLRGALDVMHRLAKDVPIKL